MRGETLLLCLAGCVSDAPSSDAGADSTTDTGVDTGMADAGAPDTASDVVDATCSNPPTGSQVLTPTMAIAPFFFVSSAPFQPGDVTLTGTNYGCSDINGCTYVPGTIAGGLTLKANGNVITIERRVDLQFQNYPQEKHLDRFSGTFDPAMRKFTLVRDCPDAGANVTWTGTFHKDSDGGWNGNLTIQFDDVKGRDTDGGTPPIIADFTKK